MTAVSWNGWWVHSNWQLTGDPKNALPVYYHPLLPPPQRTPNPTPHERRVVVGCLLLFDERASTRTESQQYPAPLPRPAECQSASASEALCWPPGGAMNFGSTRFGVATHHIDCPLVVASLNKHPPHSPAPTSAPPPPLLSISLAARSVARGEHFKYNFWGFAFYFFSSVQSKSDKRQVAYIQINWQIC